LTKRIAGCAVLLLPAILLAPTTGVAQNFGAPLNAALRVTVTRVVERRSGPAISGYVENSSPNLMTNVRLHVRELDDSGHVVSEADGTLLGDVPAFGRGPFEVRVKSAGARHEVTVVHAEPLHLKGGM
jgi:hypothetical protein